MKDISPLTVLVTVNKFLKGDRGRIERNETAESDRNFSPRLRQFYITSGIFLTTVSFGMVLGYSAILLPQLKKEGNMKIDHEMSSWIASISALPTPLGCILGGWLMEVIGRRAIHMLCCVPCMAGWILIYFSTSTTPILIGRFTTGLCFGILGPPSGVYIAETSDPNLRGFLIASLSLAITLGIAISHIVGTFLYWQNTALVGSVFPMLCFLLMIPAPESPTFLARKSEIAEATKAFYWFRGYDSSAELELQELITRQNALAKLPKKNCMDYLKHLAKREFLKPLTIITLLFITSQWCGHNAVTFYNVDIIKRILGDWLDEYTAMIIMDVVRLIMAVLACWLMRMLGRRPLTMLSGVGTVLSLFILSGFSLGMKFYPKISDYSIYALLALVAYMAFITIGLAPMPWTMMGELFPSAYRGMGAGMCSLVNSALIFSVVKTTPWMFMTLGTDGTFLLFGVVALVGTVALAIFLPETKNKPLHEIEDQLRGIEVSDFKKLEDHFGGINITEFDEVSC